jgi:hypothetical protein
MELNNPFVGVKNGGQPQRTKTQVNITPSDLKTLVCEYCQGVVFAEGLIIKTVSPLLTENGKEGMLPIPAFYCVACHKAVQKYLPEELREKKLVSK